MKINKIMFLILTCIFIIIACISFFEEKKVTAYETKDSLSITKCLGHTDYIKKYEDLKMCDTFDFEKMDPDGVDYDIWKNSNEKHGSLSLKDCCNAYKNNIPLSPDYYTIFFGLFYLTSIMNYYFVWIIGLIVFFALYGLNKLFRSKYIFYYSQRKKYGSFMIKNILKSYCYVIPLIIFFIILYAFSLTFSTHLDRTYIVGDATFNEIYYQNPYFLVFYCIQNCLMCLTFINVGIIFLKNNKLIFAIIETYIVYFLAALIITYFNLVPLNILFEGKIVNIYVAVLWGLLYFAISAIALFITYSNKEEVMKKLGRS